MPLFAISFPKCAPRVRECTEGGDLRRLLGLRSMKDRAYPRDHLCMLISSYVPENVERASLEMTNDFYGYRRYTRITRDSKLYIYKSSMIPKHPEPRTNYYLTLFSDMFRG